MNTLPFTCSNVLAGLGVCEGLLREEDQHLCLEFRLKDAVIGVLAGQIQKLHIPMQDLVSVTFTKGLWGATVGIQVARLDCIKDFPGMSSGQLSLEIARRNRQSAEVFVAELNERMEHALAEAEPAPIDRGQAK